MLTAADLARAVVVIVRLSMFDVEKRPPFRSSHKAGLSGRSRHGTRETASRLPVHCPWPSQADSLLAHK